MSGSILYGIRRLISLAYLQDPSISSLRDVWIDCVFELLGTVRLWIVVRMCLFVRVLSTMVILPWNGVQIINNLFYSSSWMSPLVWADEIIGLDTCSSCMWRLFLKIAVIWGLTLIYPAVLELRCAKFIAWSQSQGIDSFRSDLFRGLSAASISNLHVGSGPLSSSGSLCISSS